MSENKTQRIKKFNKACGNNRMFKVFSSNNSSAVKVNTTDICNIFEFLKLGVYLNIGFFSKCCKRSINNYNKLIKKYPNIKNDKIKDIDCEIDNFLCEEKTRWGREKNGYLKHRISLENKEKKNKNLDKDEQEMNKNKKIIAMGISRLTREEGTPVSNATIYKEGDGCESSNTLPPSHVGISRESMGKIKSNSSNASQDRKNRPLSSHNLNKSNPNIHTQSQNGSQHPFGKNTSGGSFRQPFAGDGHGWSASSSSSNLNVQNINMAMQFQNGYQNPFGNDTYMGSFGTPNKNICSTSMASSSYNNSNWPNSNVTMHSSQNGSRPLKDRSVDMGRVDNERNPDKKKIRRNPSDRGSSSNLS